MSEATVGNISEQAVAIELVDFLESKCGRGAVVFCSIETYHGNWSSKGYGYVQFSSSQVAAVISQLAQAGDLVFFNKPLRIDIRKNAGHASVRGSSRADGLVLSVGYMKQPGEMGFIWSSDGVSLEISYENTQLSLLVEEEHKLELHFSDFSSLDGCIVCGNKALVLQISRPPQIYKGSSMEQGAHVLNGPLAILRHFKALQSNSSNYNYCKWPSQPHWARTTDFTEEKAFSQSLVYCLQFPESSALCDEMLDVLASYRASGLGGLLSLVKVPPYAGLEQEAVPILDIKDDNLSSAVVYKLNYLVQCGRLSPAAVNNELFSLLGSSGAQACIFALKKLEKQIVKEGCGACLDPLSSLRSYLSTSSSDEVVLAEGQTYVKRLVVTPTKVYCMGPELEGSNRVTRNFAHLIDNFVRVSFVDEDFGPLHSTAVSLPRKTFQPGLLPEPSDVYHRIMALLEKGIVVGKQHFKFLAFSTSQLRENSCWMFADASGTTVDSIRFWMGSFDQFRNVAKCAARMGQSFSSSKQGLLVSDEELSLISDVETNNGGIKYCFSDGIGKVSKLFGTELAKQAGCKQVPSAFQIRYGGYKGVVAVDPKSSFKMSLRPSMYKFPSKQTGLDVLSWTQYAPYYLNRQVIVLLSTLGVEDEAFLRMQQRELYEIDNIWQDTSLAVEMIRSSSGGGESHTVMVEMLLAGYPPSGEPYLRMLMDSFRALQLHLLRVRSRIYVPKGRSLMGCLDETTTLEYGQVFVQVSPTPGTVDDGLPQPQPGRGACGRQLGCVVRGRVAIAKNPCLHPGDILVLEAIDVPELHHMLDCVVFPQQGQRPHPNECSGSDLDGDLYYVTWEPTFIPPLKVEPMSYEPSTPAVLDHPVTLQEIKEFFVDNMLNDSLGVISNAHLVHADLQDEGASHPNCIELARLASTAVDFAKTGVPAVIPANLRPTRYPDFMENEFKSSYESQRVLGKLYRSLCAQSGRIELAKYVPSSQEIVQEYDSSLLVDNFEQHVEEAAELKKRYDSKLYGLMERYQTSEAELLTGNILGMSKRHQKSPGDARDRIALAVASLRKEAQGWFGEAERQSAREAKAYAWYHVTYHPSYRIAGQQHLLSFPWLLFVDLLRIKKRQQSSNHAASL